MCVGTMTDEVTRYVSIRRRIASGSNLPRMITGSAGEQVPHRGERRVVLERPDHQVRSGREGGFRGDGRDVIRGGLRQRHGPAHLGTAGPARRARRVDQRRAGRPLPGVRRHRRCRLPATRPRSARRQPSLRAAVRPVGGSAPCTTSVRRPAVLAASRTAARLPAPVIAHDDAGVGILVGEFVGAQLARGGHGADADGERGRRAPPGSGWRSRRGPRPAATTPGAAASSAPAARSRSAATSAQVRVRGIVGQRYLVRRGLGSGTNGSGHVPSFGSSTIRTFVSSKETALRVKKLINSPRPATTGTPRRARRSSGAGCARTAGKG